MKFNEFYKGWKLRVFDFDDTLVKTSANVHAVIDGKKRTFTPAEFAKYKRKPDDEFDFSDFDKLTDPENIKHIVRILQAVVKKGTGKKAMVLTARHTAKPVDEWLKSMGMKIIPVKALGVGDPMAKANYIEKMINNGATDVEFFDDSHDNIKAVDKLKKKYPNVKIITNRVEY